jgi:hypothetical protein
VARALLAALLAVGALTLLLVPEPGSFATALAVMLVVFLVGAARLAIDLVDLVTRDLLADAGVVIVSGVALAQVSAGDVLLTEGLFAAGIASQAVPWALRRRTT